MNANGYEVAVATSLFNASSASFKSRKRDELEYNTLLTHLVKTGSFPSLRDWGVLIRGNMLDLGCDPLAFSSVLSSVEYYKYPGYTYCPRRRGIVFNSAGSKAKSGARTLLTLDGANKTEKFCTFVINLSKSFAHDCKQYVGEIEFQIPHPPGKPLSITAPVGTGLAGKAIEWSASELLILEPEYLCDQLLELSRLYEAFSIQFSQVRQLFREQGVTNLVFPTLNFMASGQYDRNFRKGFPRRRPLGLMAVSSQGTFFEFAHNSSLDLLSIAMGAWLQLKDKLEIRHAEYRHRMIGSHLPITQRLIYAKTNAITSQGSVRTPAEAAASAQVFTFVLIG